jgi:3-oxoisoapionate decarboxylase
MRAGLCSYAYRWAILHPGNSETMDVFKFVDQAVELGTKTIQICDNLPVEYFSQSELESLKEYISKNSLSLELGMKGSQPDRVKKMMAHCKKLDVGLLRIVLSDKGWNLSNDEYKKILKELSKEAQDNNIILAVENHFEMSSHDLAHIIESIDSPNLGVCLDLVNSVTHLCGYKETCTVLAPFAVTVHMKDVKLNRFQQILINEGDTWVSPSTRKEILETFSTGFYISGCQLGQGVIDIGWVIQEIAKNNHNPDIFLESWMDPKSTPGETIRAEQHMVETDFKTLKTYTNE